MKNWLVLVLIGSLCFTGCYNDTVPEEKTTDNTGEEEPPFTGLTSINAVDSYLNQNHDHNRTPDDPVKLNVKISATEWEQLFNTIYLRDTYVALDISQCYDVPKSFVGRYNRGSGNKIVSLVLPDGITSIGNNAFSSYANLRQITLPAGLTEIRDGAFERCMRLTEIDLPVGLKIIGKEAFKDCTRLMRVIFRASVPPDGSKDIFEGIATDFTIEVPPNGWSVNLYKMHPYWSDYKDKIISL